MAIRITQNAISNRFQTDVQSIYAKMAKSQQQISDGKRVTRPSDDPAGAGRIIDFDAQIVDVQRYQSSIKDAIGVLDTQDTSLDTITTALSTIRTKALQAKNDTNNLSDRASIAQEITQLKEVIRDAMNAQHAGAYVFSGTGSATQPYPAPANAYAGTNNVVSKLVGPNQTVATEISGETVLNPQPGNTFDIIDQLVLDIQGGISAGIDTGIVALDGEIDRTLNVRTDIGARTSRLETMGDRMGLAEERLKSARSEVADVDAAEAYMNFTIQQNMYQASLAAGTRMLKTTILDFI